MKYDSDGTPTRTSTNPSSYTNPLGEIFATVGTGGINFHGVGGKSYFVASQQASAFGILYISMSDDGTKLIGKYCGNDGKLKDQFTISKTLTTSSLKISRTNSVNITNQTSPQDTTNDQVSGTPTANSNQTTENRSSDFIKDSKSILPTSRI